MKGEKGTTLGIKKINALSKLGFLVPGSWRSSNLRLSHYDF